MAVHSVLKTEVFIGVTLKSIPARLLTRPDPLWWFAYRLTEHAVFSVTASLLRMAGRTRLCETPESAFWPVFYDVRIGLDTYFRLAHSTVPIPLCRGSGRVLPRRR